MICSENDYNTVDDVKAAYPGAACIVAVEGGWLVFELITDFETWSNQK
jgi:hypothetical protein